MQAVAVIIISYGLIYQCDAVSLPSLKWSKSYSLKAVLTIPSANISESYQVWVNGAMRRSRVDFYDGLVKLYRQWNEIDEIFEYFQIHPDPEKSDRVVCNKVNSTSKVMEMRILNSFLPKISWIYVYPETIKNIEAYKFIYEHPIKEDNKIVAKRVYSVWITFKEEEAGTATPIRFVNKLKYGNRVLEYFRHDYLYFEASEPDVQTLLIPLGMQCNPYPSTNSVTSANNSTDFQFEKNPTEVFFKSGNTKDKF